jgi:hypothetical protein
LELATDREGVNIYEAESANARAISSLIALLAYEAVLAGSAAEEHAPSLRSVSPSAIAKHPGNGTYRYQAVVHGDRIVGGGAIMDNKHLYHLFVATDNQPSRRWNSLFGRAPANPHTSSGVGREARVRTLCA